ncbi:MAG: hypothetical protein ACRBCL_04010, partial [Maritimibacter sp.]
MRDVVKDQIYWESYLLSKKKLIDKILARLLGAPEAFDNRVGDAYNLQRHQFALVSALYSSGAPEEDCLSA